MPGTVTDLVTFQQRPGTRSQAREQAQLPTDLRDYAAGQVVIVACAKLTLVRNRLPHRRRIPARASVPASDGGGTEEEAIPDAQPTATLSESPAPAVNFSFELLTNLLVRRWPEVALLLLPWILFLINSNWPFQGLGHMDPWYYFGYFSHFPQYQRVAPQYSGERLTWILPGFILSHIFSHVYGTLLLHILTYNVSVFSTYYIVKTFRGSRTAFATACLLGCHPLFIGANGWDYVDGGSIAYLSLAFVFLTKAARCERPRVYIALAGMAWMALIVTYLFWVTFTPVCFGYYACLRISRNSQRSLKDWAKSAWHFALPFTFGVSVTTFALSLCHRLIFGGRDFFLSLNVSMAARIAKMSSNPWIRQPGEQLSGWFPMASWLVFPLLGTFLSAGLGIAWLIRRRRIDGPAIGAILAYCYSFGVMTMMTFRPARLLEIDFYASILIPLVFLLFGLTIFDVPERISSGKFYLSLLVACGICIWPLTKPGRYTILLVYGLVLPYAIGISGLLTRLFWPRKAISWVCLLICLSVSSFGLTPAYPGSAWHFPYNGLATWTRVSQSIDVIRRRVPDWQAPIFWIDDFTHPQTAEYRAIMCAVHPSNAMWRYPKVDEKASYPPGTPIVIMTDRRDVFDSANTAMARAGMPLSLLSQDFVSRDGVSYWITIATVAPLIKEMAGPNH
jgi:hypothetical protein